MAYPIDKLLNQPQEADRLAERWHGLSEQQSEAIPQEPTPVIPQISPVPPFQPPQQSPGQQQRGGGMSRTINNANGLARNLGTRKNLMKILKLIRFIPWQVWVTVFAVAIPTFIIVQFLGGGGMGGIGGPNLGETGSAAPPGKTSLGNSLDFSINFRDSSVSVANPADIKNRILSIWPKAKLDNWDIIVSQSIANGWNPAFVLSLWIEETGAQGAASYSDPLGCDPKHPTTDINASLNCLFKNFPIGKYPGNKFDDLMCVYGGDGFHTAPCAFNVENPNFPKNIKNWYSQLVPSGPGTMLMLSPSSASNIVQSAFSIIQKLELRLDNCGGKNCYLYNKKSDEPSTYYWCTYLIVDSYNMSGAAGLSRAGYGLVLGMKSFFRNTGLNGGKYNFLPPDAKADQLNPGDVVFFEGRGQHVSLIKSIELDTDGDGAVKTYEANNVVIEDFISVKSFKLLNAKTTAAIYSITGFGKFIK